MSIKKQFKAILMDKKLRETTCLYAEIMSSKRQAQRKLGHVIQILSCVNVTLNLSCEVSPPINVIFPFFLK